MPSHIKETIKGVLKNLEKKHQEGQKTFLLIEDLLKGKTKDHVKSLKIKNDTLVFFVDSSLWAFQVNLMKPQILQRARQENKKIKKIKIKVSAK